MKCQKCGEPIVYSDRWFKRCQVGHITGLSPKEQYEYEKLHGVEK